MEVEHVKAHRTKEKMTKFEMFVTEGNEKADELAKGRNTVGGRVYGRSES